MVTTFNDNLGASAVSITLASGAQTLVSSATGGTQTAPIIFADATTHDTPKGIQLDLGVTVASGTPGSDQAVYLYMAQSIDGTNYTSGTPNVGTTAGSFTFDNSPVGTSPTPTSMTMVGVIPIGAGGKSYRKPFKLFDLPRGAVFIILNYSGLALTACDLQYNVISEVGR